MSVRKGKKQPKINKKRGNKCYIVPPIHNNRGLTYRFTFRGPKSMK